jgi:hypothetical protein
MPTERDFDAKDGDSGKDEGLIDASRSPRSSANFTISKDCPQETVNVSPAVLNQRKRSANWFDDWKPESVVLQDSNSDKSDFFTRTNSLFNELQVIGNMRGCFDFLRTNEAVLQLQAQHFRRNKVRYDDAQREESKRLSLLYPLLWPGCQDASTQRESEADHELTTMSRNSLRIT